MRSSSSYVGSDSLAQEGLGESGTAVKTVAAGATTATRAFHMSSRRTIRTTDLFAAQLTRFIQRRRSAI